MNEINNFKKFQKIKNDLILDEKIVAKDFFYAKNSFHWCDHTGVGIKLCFMDEFINGNNALKIDSNIQIEYDELDVFQIMRWSDPRFIGHG